MPKTDTKTRRERKKNRQTKHEKKISRAKKNKAKAKKLNKEVDKEEAAKEALAFSVEKKLTKWIALAKNARHSGAVLSNLIKDMEKYSEMTTKQRVEDAYSEGFCHESIQEISASDITSDDSCYEWAQGMKKGSSN